jgi:hypothetical protein
MQTLECLAQFRQQVYQTFTQRPAALLELVDAVAQTPRPHAPAELSLSMQRHWTSLYDALRHGCIDLDKLRPLLAKTASTAAPYRVAGCRVVLFDHTGFPRPAARTVADRECYPGPNALPQVGHRYSWLSQLVDAESSWLAPLDVERIGPGDKPVGIALTQLARLAQNSSEPIIGVGDRAYGVDDMLRVIPKLPGVPLVTVTRVRSNLVFYQAPPPRQPGQRGRTRVYGARVQLNDPTTWPAPDWQEEALTETGERIVRQGWTTWRRRGIPKVAVQLVQVRVLRADGQAKYKQALWLMVVGALEGRQATPLYGPRWREETWHRQAKDLFGWSRAQLGDVARQDRWTWVVLVASWQVLLARALARDCPRAWERATGAGPVPLARVQRDFGRILRKFGLGVPAPKARGKAPGRRVGMRLEPKARQPLLKRRQKAA